MEIIVLGTGCAKCKRLEQVVRDVVAEMGVEASIKKEEDIMNIMSYGIMHTPGLVINGKVVSKGRIPTSKELMELINTNK